MTFQIRSTLLISLVLFITVSNAVILEYGARQGVPPEFQCDRDCYPSNNLQRVIVPETRTWMLEVLFKTNDNELQLWL